MGDHLSFERYYWFHREVRRGRYPNAASLVRRFELSNRTALRLIAFLRERLGAPLEYVPARRGFRYIDDSFDLPGCQVSQEELLAALVARRVLASSAGGAVAEAIRTLGDKLRVCLGGSDLTEQRLEARLSASWAGFSPAPSAVFRTVLDALLADRLLALVYRSPLSGPSDSRLIEPHHLRHYLGSWVLTAWCRERQDWRAFYLSRVEEVGDVGEAFAPRPEGEWRHRVDGAFGVFQGEELTAVTLRFNPFRAAWVREQVWHPAQQLSKRSDGSLDLSFPVADLREVKMKVLSFGADVEVIEPGELRDEVEAEVRRMAGRLGECERRREKA